MKDYKPNNFNIFCLIMTIIGILVTILSVIYDSSDMFIGTTLILTPFFMLFFFTLPDCDWYKKYIWNIKEI